MAEGEEAYLRTCWEQRVCPCCREAMLPGTAIGSGRASDGHFCSLRCYGQYHEGAIRRRAISVADVKGQQDD